MPRLLFRLGTTACALALAAGAVAGCGDGAGAGDDGLASLVPPDAPLFAEGVVRPEGDHAEAIESFAERVGAITDPGAAVVAQIDAFFASEQLDATYAEDVEPWLGDRGAVFVSSFERTGPAASSPDFALLAEVEDPEAANEFVTLVGEQEGASVEQRSYEGTDYYVSEAGYAAGVIDDTALALGTENAFEVAVDSSQGESLAESAEYTDRSEALPDDALASVFFDPAASIEAVIASEGIDPEDARMLAPLLSGLLSEPLAATLTATPDAASVDLAAMLDSQVLLSADPSLLTGLPGNAWLAIAVPELGRALEHGLDQLSGSGLPGAGQLERQVREATGLELRDDVLGWLGSATAFVAGTGVPGFSAGLVAETSDPQAPRKLLTTLQRIAERESGLTSTGPPQGADYGFSIGLPGVGGGVEAAVTGDQLVAVLGTTVGAAIDPSETLGDAPAFQAAIDSFGEDFPPAFYLDLPAFFQVAEQGSDGDIDYGAIRPYTDAFASVVAGNRVEGDLVLSRLTVSLAGE